MHELGLGHAGVCLLLVCSCAARVLVCCSCARVICTKACVICEEEVPLHGYDDDDDDAGHGALVGSWACVGTATRHVRMRVMCVWWRNKESARVYVCVCGRYE
ncbi:hypothetical protein PTSG_12266 [Salpingoeca rosetta]|uniref:Secreted protein n=1 Tax=Salpingoeca rosetta (strain ATCC 50818 / BSB-021) TaxID=946362 RepID=F2UAN7_SALR5|nr:uncharacterized protein PTSG_12266 [Salpingoeca rosetta]EGD73453.1 hypothetical protein PTSG_12266 [Salpingoeca rosetta]|eukprot:XP_004993735.1 hypothetical protein PTSG_12266 [Salpingoeca rosetta]